MRFHIEMSILWKLPCVHFADDLLVALLWSDWGQTFPFRAETIDADEEPRCSEAAGQCIDAPTDGGQHQEYWKELLMLISRLLINWSNLILLSELNQDWCSLENGNVLCTLLKWSLLLTTVHLKQEEHWQLIMTFSGTFTHFLVPGLHPTRPAILFEIIYCYIYALNLWTLNNKFGLNKD